MFIHFESGIAYWSTHSGRRAPQGIGNRVEKLVLLINGEVENVFNMADGLAALQIYIKKSPGMENRSMLTKQKM